MIDTVEIQQIITNLPSIEKIASTSQVLAVNSSNITKTEIENKNVENINTVVELSEVLEPINDKKKSEEEKKEKEDEENNPQPHIDLTV